VIKKTLVFNKYVFSFSSIIYCLTYMKIKWDQNEVLSPLSEWSINATAHLVSNIQFPLPRDLWWHLIISKWIILLSMLHYFSRVWGVLFVCLFSWSKDMGFFGGMGLGFELRAVSLLDEYPTTWVTKACFYSNVSRIISAWPFLDLSVDSYTTW
jgi:hypothetical protein